MTTPRMKPYDPLIDALHRVRWVTFWLCATAFVLGFWLGFGCAFVRWGVR